MKLFIDKIKLFVLVFILIGIPLLTSNEVKADNFYISDGDAEECHVGVTTSISYGLLPTQQKGLNGITFNPDQVQGIGKDRYAEETKFAPDLGTLAYPNARRYPDIATSVSVPPNSRIDIGFYDHNYSGHNTWIYDAYLFLSRQNPNNGDLGKLGAGGAQGTVAWKEGEENKSRSGRLLTVPVNYEALIDENPANSSQNGRTIYSFTTIQPIIVESRTITPEFLENGNLRLKYDLKISNKSQYNLPNILVTQLLPNAQTFTESFNFNPLETKVITYFAEMGRDYDNQINSAAAEIYDPNFHTETASIGDSDERAVIIRRGDSGAPQDWSANQPDYVAPGDYLGVTLIPYTTYSDKDITIVPPKLSVSKKVSDSNELNVKSNTVEPNEQFSYTIEVKNTGGTARNVQVIDDYDQADLTIISTDPIGIDNGETISWNLGDMANGEIRTLNIIVKSKTGFTQGTYQVPNNVRVIADNHTHINDDTQTNILAKTNLTIEKTVSDSDESNTKLNKIQGYSNDSVRTITYNITVKNNGTATATQVVLTDQYDKNSISIIDGGGGIIENGKITWNIGTLAIGESKTFTIRALVSTGLSDLTKILNTAIVDSSETDPISDSVTTIIEIPILQIIKSQVLPLSVSPGQVITYEIEYKNIGSATSYETKITDILSSNLVFIEFIDQKGDFDKQTNSVVWNLGDLNSGSSDKVSLKVYIKVPTPSNTEIKNIALIESPNALPVSSETISTTTISACLGGLVWDDNNKNGIYDEDENGVANAKVILSWNQNEYVESGSITLITDDTGHYEYSGLPYFIPIKIEILKPAGFDQITTADKSTIVFLPPTADGKVIDYVENEIRYLTASGCVKFLNVGIYRDIVIADTGNSIIVPITLSLLFIFISFTAVLLYLTRTKK